MSRDAHLQALVGKTIKSIETDLYHTRVTVEFTDGTKAHFIPGRENAHNDFWSTVNVGIEQA